MADVPAVTPVSSMSSTVGASEVVSNTIRSAAGTNCQPDDGTIGGVGDIGGTAIQPSALGVIVKIPAPVRFTQTSITSRNGGTAIERMNCPMFVSSIWRE